MSRPPVYLPARLPSLRQVNRRRRVVSLAALLGEGLIIAAGFFALGLALVTLGAALAPVIPGA